MRVSVSDTRSGSAPAHPRSGLGNGSVIGREPRGAIVVSRRHRELPERFRGTP
jgi:hypothetical protein